MASEGHAYGVKPSFRAAVISRVLWFLGEVRQAAVLISGILLCAVEVALVPIIFVISFIANKNLMLVFTRKLVKYTSGRHK